MLFIMQNDLKIFKRKIKYCRLQIKVWRYKNEIISLTADLIVHFNNLQLIYVIHLIVLDYKAVYTREF